MSNSYYADTFKWMEDQSEQYINDINQLGHVVFLQHGPYILSLSFAEYMLLFLY